MKITSKVFPIIFNNLPLILISIFFSFSLTNCEQAEKKPSKMPQAQRGKVIFDKYCVSCHGAHGDGIGASNLETKPADLTTIVSRRRLKKFPVAEIARYIDGRQFAKSHGEREMPIWGKVFSEQENMTLKEIKGKLGDLIGYLASIQDK